MRSGVITLHSGVGYGVTVSCSEWMSAVSGLSEGAGGAVKPWTFREMSEARRQLLVPIVVLLNVKFMIKFFGWTQ